MFALTSRHLNHLTVNHGQLKHTVTVAMQVNALVSQCIHGKGSTNSNLAIIAGTAVLKPLAAKVPQQQRDN